MAANRSWGVRRVGWSATDTMDCATLGRGWGFHPLGKFVDSSVLTFFRARKNDFFLARKKMPYLHLSTFESPAQILGHPVGKEN